jgi:hypothetical protein
LLLITFFAAQSPPTNGLSLFLIPRHLPCFLTLSSGNNSVSFRSPRCFLCFLAFSFRPLLKMARGGSTEVPVASVADYNSSDGEELADTRKQANMAMKRSKDQPLSPALTALASDSLASVPSLASDSTEKRSSVPADGSSDSGYSSRTLATVASSSADSSKSFKKSEDQASSTAASEVHTITSSTHDEDDSPEVFTRNGKKYMYCRDPNCKKKHRAPKSKTSAQSSVAGSTTQSTAGASNTSTSSPTKGKKVKLPKEPEREQTRDRQTSPKQKPTQEKPVQQKPVQDKQQQRREPERREPERPSLRQRSVSASAPQPRRYSGYGYPVPPAAGPPIAYYNSGRYPNARGGTMLVSRSPVEHSQRPPLPPHRATEVSARQVKPGAMYGQAAPLIRQDSVKPTISARKPSDSNRSTESATESDEDDDDYSSEDDQEPSSRDYYELRMASQQATAEQRKLRDMQLEAFRQQQQQLLQQAAERDRQNMPPPVRPPSVMKMPSANNTTQSFSMRQVAGGQSPRIIQDPSQMLRPALVPQSAPALTREEMMMKQMQMQQQLQDASLRPMMGQKLASQPILGMDSGLYAGEARTQQRRPSSFYDNNGSIPSDLEVFRQQILTNEAREIALQNNQDMMFQEHVRARREAEAKLMAARYGQVDSMYETDDIHSELTRLNVNEQSKIRDAQRHINSTREVVSPPVEGILRRPSHSQRSSRDSSSISIPDPTSRRRESLSSAATNRRSESTITRETHAATTAEGGFKMRLDPTQGYEIEIENRRIAIRPGDDGNLELAVGAKREKKYRSNGSVATSTVSAATSSMTRKQSKKQKARFEEQSSSEEESEDEDLRRRKEKARVKEKGAARRRAEGSESSWEGVSTKDSEVTARTRRRR